MKCPLFQESAVYPEDHHIQEYETARECGEDCAWYDKGNETCVIISIKDALRRLGQVTSLK